MAVSVDGYDVEDSRTLVDWMLLIHDIGQASPGLAAALTDYAIGRMRDEASAAVISKKLVDEG